jgi:apolipoprotein D and lipocalin family protein
MNSDPPRPASRPLRPEAGAALAWSRSRPGGPRAPSLDDRILAVEARLIAREQAIGAQWQHLVARVRVAVRPRRLLAPLIGVGAAAFVLWWLLRGRGTRGAATIAHAAHTAHAAHAAQPLRGATDLPWMPLFGFVWPLLPQRWRARISPATAATVLGIGVPLLERLLAGRSHPALETVDQVDLARYAGTWYEIARLPQRGDASLEGQPIEHYRFSGNGLQLQQYVTSDGSDRALDGVAQPLAGSGNAKLRRSVWPPWLRWLPLAWTHDWILYVDEGYDMALVGHPNRQSLRVLSRRPRMNPAHLEALLRVAAERGFDIERVQRTEPT